MITRQHSASLFDPSSEHDACGVGFVAATGGDRRNVIKLALESLSSLAHRGGVNFEDRTGDGAGVLTQIPTELFASELKRITGKTYAPDQIGVGVFFLPREESSRATAQKAVEAAFAAAGVPLHCWREAPVDESAIGSWAESVRPAIYHAIVTRPPEDDELQFERRLYQCRRKIEREAAGRDELQELYVASLSGRTIVYKGLLWADQVGRFYKDLQDPRFSTAIAVYHQRLSTNTKSSWRRAQPFRLLAHNGEINTLQGNVTWMKAREAGLSSPSLAEEALASVVGDSAGDSAALDNTLELLYMAGRDPVHALMMLVPEAWEGIEDLSAERKAFYRFHSCLMEPWDGPSAIVFSDGRIVCAGLDRNGLRPLRYTVTKDGYVIASSEAGTVNIPAERIERLGKLGPGQLIAVDAIQGRIVSDQEIKERICSARPYGAWLERELKTLDHVMAHAPSENGRHEGTVQAASDPLDLVRRQAAFGYTSEEITVVLRPMVENAKEPNGSMGDDTPQAVLSRQQRPLFHYFKQRFAGATNPPIDHFRERLVFSLRTLIGPRGNLLDESPEQARLIELDSPILLNQELSALKALGERDPQFKTETISTLFSVENGRDGLEPAIIDLCRRAEDAVDRGAHILILSDRNVDKDHAPIPSLLAVGAVHHHLIRCGKRMRVSLIAETGEPREVHHFATLVGYGASAVNPYLAFATIDQQIQENRIRIDGVTAREAHERFREAVEEGLLKVMSKMGVSTLASYIGAQAFEAIGIAQDVIDACFAGTASPVSGNGFPEIADLALAWHGTAFDEKFSKLGMYGFYKPRKSGEFHDFTPETARQLQKAVILGAEDDPEKIEAGYKEYKTFVDMVRSQPSRLRDLLEIHSDREPIPVEEVEPIEAITRRFSTAQMSLGALSPEAHETLSIAMNRLHGRSGSGEGGEDAGRFGTERNSAVKQIASGRFGVTPAYLASAAELQIKLGQGAKPGEGGQIPGDKVTALIARLRHTVPGVALISPPCHHDVYSIEDLMQLIYDVKQANPEAEISVKFVSHSGVGQLAVTVARGGADIILISGASGGTGSAALTSIKNTGLPWEIGLAETQQALLASGLRERVCVRTDGGLKSARDVVIAALLGADEYSFGTIGMIAEGCIMARVCHTNNCPVGVATQDEALRAKFPGKPEMVMAYFRYLAREVREFLASLGYRSLDELIGKTELLRQSADAHEASARLDLARLLAIPDGQKDAARRRVWTRNPLPPETRLDSELIERSRRAIEAKEPVEIDMEIANSDRTVGTTLSYEIARRHGDAGLPKGTITARFSGTAGQSFGAFLANGVHLHLTGQANDFVGKGMSGGEIVVRPDPKASFAPHENVIVGNTVLYGATGGELYASGQAGERFAVRNSGATAVVEGVGDHACEYMTGGTVVVLGRTGYNFGAGMTGGEAFVLDEDGRFASRINPQLVTAAGLDPEHERRLRRLLLDHYERTASPKAAALLSNWEESAARFVRVAPRAEVGALSKSQEGAAS